MTERAIEAMIVEAEARFAVQGALVIHRVGRLLPGERIVLVATMSPHRRDAFQACEFLMDYLKTHAPFWKKETTGEGERWVDARVADDAAAQRWGLASANAAGGQGGESGRG
jgi:molybdopterin synthase catalytic subunit